MERKKQYTDSLTPNNQTAVHHHYVPSCRTHGTNTNTNTNGKKEGDGEKTMATTPQATTSTTASSIRILLVSDFDLRSTSRLAESPLLSSSNRAAVHRRAKRRNGDGGRPIHPLLERSVDLCIAVNASAGATPSHRGDTAAAPSYDGDDELLSYYKGKERRDRILFAAGRDRQSPAQTGADAEASGNSNSNSNSNSNACDYADNGTVVLQLLGRSRPGLSGVLGPPGGTEAEPGDRSPSFRDVPVPVPLPPLAQPVFHGEGNCNGNRDGIGGDATPFPGNDENDGKSSNSENSGREIGDGHRPDNSDRSNDRSICRHHRRFPLPSVGGPEELAARLGLITASLAQLESIVCRVAYLVDDMVLVHNNSDPSHHAANISDNNSSSSISGDGNGHQQGYKYRRLTSNSLDIANRWLPLIHGLGIGGMIGGEKGGSLEKILRLAHPAVWGGTSDTGNSIGNGIDNGVGNGIGNGIGNKEQTATNGQRCHPHLFQSIVVNTGQPASQPGVPNEPHDPESASPSFVGDHCLLEIAAGARGRRRRENGDSTGKSPSVVFPGSLRADGEFCLIDLVRRTKDNDNGDNDNIASGATTREFLWEVERTQHFCLD